MQRYIVNKIRFEGKSDEVVEDEEKYKLNLWLNNEKKWQDVQS